MMLREYVPDDWPDTWNILRPEFRGGETCAFSQTISEEETKHVWIDIPTHTYVAVNDDNSILGTYYLKPNQPGLGSHVCNAGYIVANHARGQGVASAMCEHSQQTAKDLGYLAMQFNMVVSTNEGAVRLWRKHGLDIVGTLPKAFRHPQHGLVDAYVMYKVLAEDA